MNLYRRLLPYVGLIISLLSANLQQSKRKIEQLNRSLAQESANRLQIALSAAQMGMWDWDLVKEEITWSPEHEQLFGLDSGTFDGKYATFDERLHPDDREGLNQAVAHSLRDRAPYCHEFRVVWADGSIHWIEGRGQAFYDGKTGQPVRMSGTVMAIDERKQAQLSLQQQFEQQRLVVEMTQRIRESLNLQDILQTTVDEVRRFLQVDRVIVFQFASKWGGTVTVESVADTRFSILPFDIHDPCIGNKYVESFKQGLVTAKADIYTAEITPCHVEFLAQLQIRANLVVPILKDNELWGLLAAHHCTAPRQWQESEIDLLRQVSFQVSIALQQSSLLARVQTELIERQQAEAALQQRESLLRLFAQYAPAGVAMFDSKMRYIMASQRWVDEYSLESVASLIDRSHYEIFPEISDHWRQIHQRCLAGAIEKCDEDLFVRADGTPQWVSWEVRPWHTTDDQVGGIIVFSVDITQRKQSEIDLQALNAELEQRVADRTAELQQTNDLLTNFFNAASSAKIGLCIQDLDLRYVRINEALAAANGHPVEAHLGKTTAELLPELASTINPLLQQVIETGQSIANIEIVTGAQSQPQAIRHWLSSYFPILQRGSETQSAGVGAIVIEISDRKQAEIALQQQTRQKQLLWNITQAIRQSLDLKVILNTAVTEVQQLLQVERVAIYRFNPNWSGDFIVESVADGWVKLVDPDICKVWEDTHLQETQGGRFQNHETSTVADIYTANLQPCHIELLEQFQARAYAIAPIFVGETLWGLFALYHNAAPHPWQPWEVELLDQIASQLAIAIQQSELYSQLQTELQERQQAAAVLREAERRWQFLLNNVQLIVVGLDPSGNINYVNPFFLSLTEYSESEVLGKNWFENFLPSSHQESMQAIFSNVLNSTAYPYYQDSIVTKFGEERFIAWNNTMLQGSDGNVIGTISIGEDITERQKVEEMKNEFIGIVSHELRTPLTAIQMSLGLLQTGIYAKKPEKSQRMIEIALTDTNRLVNLVNDILDLERLESGRAVLERSVCQAADLMQQAVDGVQTIAAQQNLTIAIDPTDATVWAAADTILQTLTNLLSNAIKFSPIGAGIYLRAERQADTVLFQVSDQGRGIPADKLETVFGRFQQVDASDAREKGGTGLGLPICRSIIERHSGKIWAESPPGAGSTFFFTLPIPSEKNV